MKNLTLLAILFIAASLSFSFTPHQTDDEEIAYAFVTWIKEDYTKVLVTNIFKVKEGYYDCSHEEAGITNQLRNKIKSDGFLNEMGNAIFVWCADTKSEAEELRDERIEYYENFHGTDYSFHYYNFYYSQD